MGSKGLFFEKNKRNNAEDQAVPLEFLSYHAATFSEVEAVQHLALQVKCKRIGE